MNSWVQIAMCYSEIDKQSKLNYYINGELKRSYINEKIILPKIIKYIGNSADFDEPFGAFCDLRIYKGFLESDKVYRLFELNQKISDNDFEFIDYLYSNCLNTILANFIESDDFSEETFYFMIKIINALVAYSDFRYRFIVHKIIMKINSFLNVEKFEIKKDIAKFNISIA